MMKETRALAMKHLVSTLLLATCTVLPLSVQAQDANSKAILDAIQGLNSRLDGMQKDIDGLKGGAAKAPVASNAPAAALAPAANPTPVAPPAPRASGQLRPGWIVSAFDKKENANGNFDSDPVGKFVWSHNNFNKNMHSKSFSATNGMSYRAEAFFRANYKGRYVFAARADVDQNIWTPQCKVSMAIDEKIILENKFEQLGGGNIVQGGIDLDGGDYKIRFEHICNFDSMNPTNTYAERRTNFLLMVRSPEDLTLRDLKPDEIVHIAKGGQRSSVDTPSTPGRAASSAANPTPPAPGSTRMVKSEVNVRQQPSTAAPVVATLDPGNRLRIAALSSDQQWAHVEINGQRIGFIRVTALNLNTQ